MESYNETRMITIGLDTNIAAVSEIFTKNHTETIFVMNSENKLCGIITMGDFFRKGRSAENIAGLMNIDFFKIDVSETSNPDNINAAADKIFAERPTVNKIPVVDSFGGLLFAIPRGEDFRFTYSFEGYSIDEIMKILEFRDDDSEITEFLKMADIKSIAVLKDDRIVEYIGNILSSKFDVDFYENVEMLKQAPDYKNKYDMVLLHEAAYSPQSVELAFDGFFVQDCKILFNMIDHITRVLNCIKKLSKLTNRVFLFKTPGVYNVKNPSEKERDLTNITKAYDVMLTGMNIYGDERMEYVKELDGAMLLKRDDEYYWRDCRGKYFNAINGRRVTAYKSGEYNHKLFVLGNSVVFGHRCEDKSTVPSFMQKILNDYEKSYEVVNCGIPWTISMYNVLEEAKKGDKIIIVLGAYLDDIVQSFILKENIDNVIIHPLNYLFDRPHNMGDVFFDRYHFNHIGYKAIAEEIVKLITENDETGIVRGHISSLLSKTDNCDSELFALGLQEYLDELAKYKADTQNCGAIVMNCNPFTYGHKYLAEYAAERVEHLYVFVVSEDKSYFKYEDRLALVKAGTAHLKNVTVLPTGKFYASAITLPVYFTKDGINDGALDLTLNCGIFARYMAKVLSIKKRFVGSEPNCYVTNQYNKTLGEILPKHGLELYIIPRNEVDGEVVSASTVRKLLIEKDFDKIEKLVPSTTYKYLLKNFG